MLFHRSLQLQGCFLALVAIMGIVLFIIAAEMTQIFQSDLRSRYSSARKAFLQNNLRDSSGTESKEGVHKTAKPLPRPTAAPVTDPPWMKQAPPEPVSPFKPSGPHPFLKGDVIESPHVCRNVSVDLLIVIHSAVGHFQKRRILRETWADVDAIRGMSVRKVFALGRNSSDRQMQLEVNTEQANFGDIVQGDFSDTFGNLTFKAVNMLRWINHHCLHARFVLKTDDDIFLNVFRLPEKYLQRLAGQRHTVMCPAKRTNTSIIVRNAKSKWYVPESLLPGRTHWPAFCSGFVVLMTTDSVPELYAASFKAPFVPVDDAYTYGMLPLLAGISLNYVDISGDLLVDDNKLLTRYQDSGGSSLMLGGTVQNEASILRLWDMVLANLSPWARARTKHLQQRVNVSALTF